MGLYLSLTRRRQLSAVLVLLLLLDSLAAVVSAGAAIVVGTGTAPHAGPMRSYDANFMPVLLAIISGLHILVNIYEIEGWLLLRRRMLRYSCELNDRLKRQRFIAIGIVVLLILGVIMCIIGLATVDASLQSNLQRYMQAYRFNIIAKEKLDVMQSTFECCGRHGYKEWFEVNWIGRRYLKYINPHAIAGENDNVPFSCCDSKVERTCVHYGVETPESHYKYDPDVDVTLHRAGCKTVVGTYMRQVYAGFVLQYLWLIFFKLIIVFLSWMVASSHADACKRGDAKGPGFGHIFASSEKIPQDIDKKMSYEAEREHLLKEKDQPATTKEKPQPIFPRTKKAIVPECPPEIKKPELFWRNVVPECQKDCQPNTVPECYSTCRRHERHPACKRQCKCGNVEHNARLMNCKNQNISECCADPETPCFPPPPPLCGNEKTDCNERCSPPLPPPPLIPCSMP